MAKQFSTFLTVVSFSTIVLVDGQRYYNGGGLSAAPGQPLTPNRDTYGYFQQSGSSNTQPQSGRYTGNQQGSNYGAYNNGGGLSAAPGQPLTPNRNTYGSSQQSGSFGSLSQSGQYTGNQQGSNYDAYNSGASYGGSNTAPYSGNAGSCRLTSHDIDGPYFKPNAPLQNANPSDPPSICQHTPAYDRVFLNGTIRYQNSPTDCGAPIRALVEVWQADVDGNYSPIDPSSPDYKCRIRFYTNSDGRYSLASVFPGRYECLDCDVSGYRPAHIHWKITPIDNNQQPIDQTFTTQLYFAQDHYLAPVDACFACSSGQPTQIVHVQHYNDIKTYEGTWDVLLGPTTGNVPTNTRYRRTVG